MIALARRFRPANRDRRVARRADEPAPGARRGDGDDVHDRDRGHDRRDGDADDRRRAGRFRSLQLGVHRLSVDAGGDRAGLWPARRSLWAQAHPVRRHGRVPCGLAMLRPRPGHGGAHRLSGRAGNRRRRAFARGHDHRRRYLRPGRARPRPGDRLERLGHRRDHRADDGRISRRPCGLGHGVLGEFAARSHRQRHAGGGARRTRDAARAPDRLSRLGADDRRHRHADVRAGAGDASQPRRDHPPRRVRAGDARGAGAARGAHPRADAADRAVAPAHRRRRQSCQSCDRRGADGHHRVPAALCAGRDGAERAGRRIHAHGDVGELAHRQRAGRSDHAAHVLSHHRRARRLHRWSSAA